eukprot:1185636-Prorocentrum_minimum.AAC.2
MRRAEAVYRGERSRIEEDVSLAVGEADDLEAAVITMKGTFSTQFAEREAHLKVLQGQQPAGGAGGAPRAAAGAEAVARTYGYHYEAAST